MKRYPAAIRACMLSTIFGPATALAAGTLGNAAERIDAAHARVAGGVRDVARWVDAFFSDSNYSDEADARLEVAEQLTLARHQQAGRRTRVRGRVSLPALSKRLSLSFLGNNEVDEPAAAADTSNDPLNETTDSSSLGLEYFPTRSKRTAVSLGGGFRFSDQSAYLGPRLRYELSLGEAWNGRLIQRLRHRFGSGAESVSSLQVERALPGGTLCRQRVSVAWEAAERRDRGVQTTMTSACVLTTNEDSGLRFAWTTEHRTQPHVGLTSTRLSGTWRRFVWRHWLYVQITPFVAFEDAFDWRPRPGLQASLGMVLEGNPPAPPAEHSDG